MQIFETIIAFLKLRTQTCFRQSLAVVLHDVLNKGIARPDGSFRKTWRWFYYFGYDLFGKHVVNYSFFARFS